MYSTTIKENDVQVLEQYLLLKSIDTNESWPLSNLSDFFRENELASSQAILERFLKLGIPLETIYTACCSQKQESEVTLFHLDKIGKSPIQFLRSNDELVALMKKTILLLIK